MPTQTLNWNDTYTACVKSTKQQQQIPAVIYEHMLPLASYQNVTITF
jgi:hypothetical protein